MYCRHLTLTNFRNYVHLDLPLGPHLSVFWGDNGQGKSNLIEALYVLATTRSYRTAAERELVNWHVSEPPVFARVAAEVQRHPAPQKLEVILAETAGTGGANDGVADRPPGGEGQPPAASVRRRVRINGQHRPPVELLGHLNVVLFSPEDVELIAGPAALRRRYLDITLCQVDHVYLRTLSRYQRVLQQRNALLREARERPVRPDQFEYWDVQLVELGASMIATRVRALHSLNRSIATIAPRLATDPAGLRAEYRSSVPLGEEAEGLAGAGGAGGADEAAVARVRERFAAQLVAGRARERQQAVTLAGPHRDDAGFYAGEVDLRVFGSRGQQRSAALSLKLAEAELMHHDTGERPVLLLDDVMSELDPHRRRSLQTMILEQSERQQQVLLTATELAPFGGDFLRRADVYQVEAGAISHGVAA
jgi:DNA replication and repair protein RecF